MSYNKKMFIYIHIRSDYDGGDPDSQRKRREGPSGGGSSRRVTIQARESRAAGQDWVEKKEIRNGKSMAAA